MSKVQTDNSYFFCKTKLRESFIKDIPDLKVLDCFHGTGRIWKQINNNRQNKISIIGIEKKKYKDEVYLKGDNIKFLTNMDLSIYQAIDLDAYGIPFDQLEILFAKKYQGIVFITFIQSLFGQLPKGMLKVLDFTDKMIIIIPSLFNIDGFEKFKSYLWKRGIKQISFINPQSKKYYIAISMELE
ncbi:MAG: hypothetical protein KKB31_07655 [Nanoarchaeota archaeon]|nr:hypothetical protein [Nanoarchaeota archaeon]